MNRNSRVNEKRKVITSFIWKLLESGGVQGVQFLVQIILARLLSPKEFGIIAILLVFVNLAQVFVQKGFNTALIQKKEIDDEYFSSAFYISLTIAAVLYVVIFTFSPFIATLYNEPILIPTLRVLALILFSGSFNSIQIAYLSREFMFKEMFKSSLGGIILSGIIGIYAAYSGLGIWALVLQQLTNQVTVSIIMFFTVNWRPKLLFSYDKVKEILSFGWKILVSHLLGVLYYDIRTLIVGGLFDASLLGYYNRGEQFPKAIVTNLNGSIQSIMLPTLSANQDNIMKVKSIMRRSMLTSSFIVFPMMVGLAVVAEPLITIVLTTTWLPSVPYLQLFALTYSLTPIKTSNAQAINSMGRSDIYLKLETIKKIVALVLLFITIPFGIYAIVLGQLFNEILATLINTIPNRKMINYSFKEQISDVLPSAIISILMGLIVYSISKLNLSIYALLFVQIGVGAIVYFGISYLLKLESFMYLISTYKQFRNKK